MGEQRTEFMTKKYGFRLLNKITRKVEQDWNWDATTEEARIHFIRQSHNGEFDVEYDEREKTKSE